MEYYTTAPEAYDGFGTATVAAEWAHVNHSKTMCKPVRKVSIPDEHFQWQSMRYGSGLHPTWTEEQFQEERRWGYIVEGEEGTQ